MDGQTVIDQLIALLTNGSPMVAFAVYLIWSNNRSEKRLDAVNASFMERVDGLLAENKTEIDGLRQKHVEREDAIRERWQGVVQQLQSDRDQLERQILRTTETTQQAVERLSIAIDGLNTSIMQMSDRLTQVDTKQDRILDRRGGST